MLKRGRRLKKEGAPTNKKPVEEYFGEFYLEWRQRYEMLKDLKIVGESETMDVILTEYLNTNGTKNIELGRIKNLGNVEERRAA